MNPIEELKKAIANMDPCKKEQMLHTFIGIMDHFSVSENPKQKAAAELAIKHLTLCATI